MKNNNHNMRGPFIYLIIISLFLLTACAAPGQLGEYPNSSEDFNLSPSELIEKYPFVEHFHLEFRDKNIEAINFSDLVSAWGKPESTEKDWWFTIGELAALDLYITSALVNNSIVTVAPIYLGSVAIGYFFNENYYEWKKGDYTIRAYSGPSWLGSQKINYWDWRHESYDENIVYNVWKKSLKKFTWFYGISLHGGGDVTVNDDHYDKYGNGAGLTVGHALYISESLWQAKISATWDSNGIWLIPMDYKRSRIYVDLVFMRLLNGSKWLFGLGPSYTFDASYSDNSLSINYKNTFGGVLQAEYRQSINTAYGIRSEYIGLKRPNGRVDRADNFGVYMRFYF